MLREEFPAGLRPGANSQRTYSMFKSTVTALVAALAASPAALAESGRPVTLTHSYDAVLLSSDAGATALLAGLEQAARRTCSSRVPASGGTYTDEACAGALYVAAVKQIHAAQSAAGAELAPVFERAALTQLASAD
jgi:UrcA family protein